ncbi:acyltransferase domain-containing protein [Martelella soudanensis]|nr:acyltransferase domain-containing protein [Martelella sp. NC18]
MFAITGPVPEAENLFTHAASLLHDRDPRELVRQEPAAVLHHNRNSQILCTLQALAAAAALRTAWPGRMVVAGYSVGELAAWGVSSRFAGEDTLDLAARRAEVMDASTRPGDGLLFVRGLSQRVLAELCEARGAAIAIVNPGDAYVVGGARAALLSLADELRSSKVVRVVDMPVEVASHTERLASAAPAFRAILDRVAISPVNAGNPRLLSGIDGAPVFDTRSGLDKLAAQLSHTVQWSACLHACIEAGATAFLELGPGTALAGMAAATHQGVPARSVDEFTNIDGVRSWLSKVT